MLTDWVLVRRLARELDGQLRGARVRDAGLLPDGRTALVLHVRGATRLLAVDAFASPPLVTLEMGELGIAVEPGFVRVLAASLRGMTLEGVSARRGDRLLRLSFATRSRFGVHEGLELYLELVPRFGNLVLVKGDIIVAAAKEFSPADNAARAVGAGQPYVLPPLPPGGVVLPKEVIEADEAPPHEPLYVYRRDGELLQAHVVPLERFSGVQCSREESLLALFTELRTQRRAAGAHERTQQRRLTVTKRLDEREGKLRGELASLSAKRRNAERRDSLRLEGEHIFATLHELSQPEREAAKERAAKLFASYKKLGKTLPHIDLRERTVNTAIEAIEALRWEAARAADEDVADVEAAVLALLPGRGRAGAAPPARKRKRPALEFRTAAGSRIVVGRSPTENADLTFRVARPNDLWFHARGAPGAHVILSRDDRSTPPEADVEAAAAAAAFHSKGAESGSVLVDYTLRKHVRKQQNAPPGLVWYTHAKTLAVQPREF